MKTEKCKTGSIYDIFGGSTCCNNGCDHLFNDYKKLCKKLGLNHKKLKKASRNNGFYKGRWQVNFYHLPKSHFKS